MKGELPYFYFSLLELSARITADYTACVGYKVKVTIKGQPYEKEGDVCLDFKGFMMAFVRLITDDTDDETKGKLNFGNTV